MCILYLFLILGAVMCLPMDYKQKAMLQTNAIPRGGVQLPGFRLRHAPLVETRNATYRNERWQDPHEEARALCSVRTDEVNATANATISRRLVGVCSSRELNTIARRLESIIVTQLQQVWQTLNSIQSQLEFNKKRSVVFKYLPTN